MVLFIKTFEKYRTSEFEKAVSGQRVRNSELMFTRIYAETCRLKFLCNILYKVGDIGSVILSRMLETFPIEE